MKVSRREASILVGAAAAAPAFIFTGCSSGREYRFYPLGNQSFKGLGFDIGIDYSTLEAGTVGIRFPKQRKDKYTALDYANFEQSSLDISDIEPGAYLFANGDLEEFARQDKIWKRAAKNGSEAPPPQRPMVGFVIVPPKGEKKAKLAIVYPDFTYHAYSKFVTGNLYQDVKNEIQTVSTWRPFHTMSWYHFPHRLHPERFLRKEFPDLDYDVLSNTLIHRDPAVLDGYETVMIFGHDEYWSIAIREAFERHMYRGGNLINFSGNTCFWITDVEGDQLIVDKRGGDHWSRPRIPFGNWTAYRPQEQLLGVAWRFAGYPLGRYLRKTNHPYLSEIQTYAEKLEEAEKTGFRLEKPDHPLFEGTGGEHLLGAGSRALSIEFDGVPLNERDEVDFEKANFLPTNLELLATATCAPIRGRVYDKKRAVRVGFATRFNHPGGGSVTSFPSVGWLASVMAEEPDAMQITKNIINAHLGHAA